jgi:hypothetical protein
MEMKEKEKVRVTKEMAVPSTDMEMGSATAYD